MVGSVLLFCLFCKKLLYQALFELFGVQILLDLLLVDFELPISALPLFSGELIVLLGLLDFAHGRCVRKILNLAGRNAFLLLLPLHGFLDRDILLNSEFLEVFVEFFDALNHVFVVELQLSGELVLVDADFSILEVLSSGFFLLSCKAVLSPVLLSFFLPLFHKCLVLLEFPEILLPLNLLHVHQHVMLDKGILHCFFLELHTRKLVSEELLLNHFDLLGLESGAVDTHLLVD